MGQRRLWPTAIVAVCYLVTTLLAALLRTHAHPDLPGPLPLLLALATGVLGAVTLGPLSRRLALPAPSRIAVLALLAYALTTLSNAVEAFLFITDASPLILLTGAVLAAGLAVPVGLLWQPPATGGSVPRALRATLGGRRWWSWTWRILLPTVLWVPIYLAFAAADAPFVEIYYHRTGTTFTVPGTGVIALAELARGLLHTLALGVLAALLARGRRATWLWLSLSFATLNGWLPLLQRADWPLFLRAANAVEIAGDAVVFSGLVAALLSPRQPVRDHRGDA